LKVTWLSSDLITIPVAWSTFEINADMPENYDLSIAMSTFKISHVTAGETIYYDDLELTAEVTVLNDDPGEDGEPLEEEDIDYVTKIDRTSILPSSIAHASLTAPYLHAPGDHNHTASDITDFDTEVSNNTDVAANTSARHASESDNQNLWATVAGDTGSTTANTTTDTLTIAGGDGISTAVSGDTLTITNDFDPTYDNQTVTPAPDGAETAFTVENSSYTSDTLQVWVNGVLQRPTTDFVETTPASGIFTFTTAPETGDIILCEHGVEAGGSSSDEKAKVSSNNTTPGYLNGKLVAGTNITLTEGSDGGDETLTIASTASGGAWEIIDAQTVSGSAVQDIDFSGFSSDDYHAFRLYITWKNASGSLVNSIWLMANGDTTKTNYWSQRLGADNANLTGVRGNEPLIGNAPISGYGTVDCNFTTDVDGQLMGSWVSATNGSNIFFHFGTIRSTALGAAITSLKVRSYYGGTGTPGNYIDVGSRFVLMGIPK